MSLDADYRLRDTNTRDTRPCDASSSPFPMIDPLKPVMDIRQQKPSIVYQVFLNIFLLLIDILR
jgi:hypothetical protein